MEQQIGFCKTSDGVRIAYATLGDGPPLVYASGWTGHLELEWEKPFLRAFLQELATGTTLVRYDMRGSGLSDHDVSDFSFDSLLKDLETVVDHLRLERFDLLCLGALAGPISIAYAAAHAERVSHLILSSAHSRGSELSTPERQKALVDYVSAFGFPAFEFIDQPSLDIAKQRDVQQVIGGSAALKVQAAVLKTMFSADVSDQVGRLSMPVLILHGRGDRLIPFRLGRELAAEIPQAQFVPFDGSGAAPWAESHVIIPAIRRFLEIEVEPPAVPSTTAQGVVTILFTDVEGSTALTERLGDEAAREVLRTHERAVRDELKRHGGMEVKTTGDGFMASFSSATRALECAMALQRALAAHNQEHPETPVRVRIGLNAGEPIAEDDDLFGTAVNLAARIAAEAKGGEILASDVVRQLVAGKGFLFADRGETLLRGFEDPVRVYELGWEA